ncbi:MAG: adenylate kinase [Bacilli bacterium]
MQSIILIAPPAAGKGTQSKLLTDKYNIPHISTGDLLRKASNDNTKIGLEIKDIMNKGLLVTDEIVLTLLKDRLKQDDCSKGYILDGFPRNLDQATAYLNILAEIGKPLGDVIYLDIDYETARKRIVGRLSCTKCGAIYNDQFEDSKPLHFGTCDKCGSSLMKRADDNDETFKERFNIYLKQTYPLLDFFTKKGCLYRIGSGINKERTFKEIEKIINRGNL